MFVLMVCLFSTSGGLEDFGQFSGFPVAAAPVVTQPAQPPAQFGDFNAFQNISSSSAAFPNTSQPLLGAPQVYIVVHIFPLYHYSAKVESHYC